MSYDRIGRKLGGKHWATARSESPLLENPVVRSPGGSRTLESTAVRKPGDVTRSRKLGRLAGD
jgi:hypothetical protein